MVQFINVSKIYDNKIAAIDDLNFSINDGEFVFLIGPSGSGKTTVIKMLIRDEVPTDGKIYFDDLDITKINRQKVYKVRREIGVIFQDYKLVQDKTAYENVAFAMEAAGKRNKEIKETVPYVLDIVGLSSRLKAFPRQLSGGEQQRVAIARAIANNPKILIADEPTGNLDPASAWDIVQILSKINNWGTTVIMSTHGTDIVNSLNKRVIQMDGGKVIRDDSKGQYEMDSMFDKDSNKENLKNFSSEKKSKKTFFKTSLSDTDSLEIEDFSDVKELQSLNEGDIIYQKRKLFGFIPFFGKKKIQIHKGIEEVLEGSAYSGVPEFSTETKKNKDKKSKKETSSEIITKQVISDSEDEDISLESEDKLDDATKNLAESENSEMSLEAPKENFNSGSNQPKKTKKDKKSGKSNKKSLNTRLGKEPKMAKEFNKEEIVEEEVNLKNKKVSKKKIEEMLSSKSTPLDVLDLPKRILKDLEISGYKDVESIINDGPDKLSKRITIDPEEVVIISKAIKIFLEE